MYSSLWTIFAFSASLEEHKHCITVYCLQQSPVAVFIFSCVIFDTSLFCGITSLTSCAFKFFKTYSTCFTFPSTRRTSWRSSGNKTQCRTINRLCIHTNMHTYIYTHIDKHRFILRIRFLNVLWWEFLLIASFSNASLNIDSLHQEWQEQMIKLEEIIFLQLSNLA